MALTELIKEIERRILDSQDPEQEEVRELAGDGKDPVGVDEGIS